MICQVVFKCIGSILAQIKCSGNESSSKFKKLYRLSLKCPIPRGHRGIKWIRHYLKKNPYSVLYLVDSFKPRSLFETKQSCHLSDHFDLCSGIQVLFFGFEKFIDTIRLTEGFEHLITRKFIQLDECSAFNVHGYFKSVMIIDNAW